MTVLHVDATTDPRWASLVVERGGSLFHSAPWLSAVQDTYGFDLRAAVLTEGGRTLSAVAYALVDDELGRRVTVPFSDACDPLVATAAHWAELASALQAFGVPWSLRSLRDRWVAEDAAFAVTRRARWHLLDLRGSTDELWNAAASPFRQGVRKAQRLGAEVRPLMGESGVRDFAALHRSLRRTKYRMLSQPTGFFDALRARFSPLGGWHPLGVWVDGRLVAATVYLRWGDVLFYKFNASDPGALGARPNNALVWAGAALARSLGCTALDLGPSDEDQPGLIRFKAQTGAAEYEVTTRTWLPPHWLPDPAAARLKVTLGELTELLMCPSVDPAVSAAASDGLYRWFA